MRLIWMISTGIYRTDIPEGSSKGFKLKGEKFFAVNIHDRIHVYKNCCPHLRVQLEWLEDKFLDDSGTMIQCANHGALFIIETGQCVAGPCSGQALNSVKFLVENELIYLDLDI